jgi:hypothetical protein
VYLELAFSISFDAKRKQFGSLSTLAAAITKAYVKHSIVSLMTPVLPFIALITPSDMP